jgi:hypothetical protein
MGKSEVIFNEFDKIKLYKINTGYCLVNSNSKSEHCSLYGPEEIFVIKPNSNSIVKSLKTNRLEKLSHQEVFSLEYRVQALRKLEEI